MPTDLISPWLAAVERSDEPALRDLLQQHTLLDDDDHRALRAIDAPRLRVLARRASADVLQRTVIEALARTARLGIDTDVAVLFAAGSSDRDLLALDPWRSPAALLVRLNLVGAGGNGRFDVSCAVTRGVALATRWSAVDSRSMLARRIGSWDRLALARTTPLAEWIYAEGIAQHVAIAAHPGAAPWRVLGMSRERFERLRAHERGLVKLLEAELDLDGIGPVVRWLPEAPGGAIDGIPPHAGRYLAWRLTAARARDLPEALRAAA